MFLVDMVRSTLSTEANRSLQRIGNVPETPIHWLRKTVSQDSYIRPSSNRSPC